MRHIFSILIIIRLNLIEDTDSQNMDEGDVNDDTSIATSEVLSKNDLELLNSSDHENIQNVVNQLEVNPSIIPPSSRERSKYKSSTYNTKNNDLLEKMHNGKFCIC